MEKAVERIGPLALAFVFVGIVIAFGSVILAEIQGMDVISQDTNSTAYETINATQSALGTFGSFLGVIAVVSLAAIIFVLLRVFGTMGGPQGYA